MSCKTYDWIYRARFTTRLVIFRANAEWPIGPAVIFRFLLQTKNFVQYTPIQLLQLRGAARCMRIYFLLLQKIEVKICSIISVVFLFQMLPSILTCDVGILHSFRECTDVVVLVVVYRWLMSYWMLFIYINKFWIYHDWSICSIVLLLGKHCEYSKMVISNAVTVIWLYFNGYSFLFFFVLLKLRMVTQLEMKSLLFVQWW